MKKALKALQLTAIPIRGLSAAELGCWNESVVEETDNLIDKIRKNIFDTLTILSCREQQSKYPVPVEWICFWFDDYYNPTDDLFQKAFSAIELKVLSEFNDFFDSAFKKIDEPPVKPDELWVIPEWQQIMQKADLILRKLIEIQGSQQQRGTDGV